MPLVGEMRNPAAMAMPSMKLWRVSPMMIMGVMGLESDLF